VAAAREGRYLTAGADAALQLGFVQGDEELETQIHRKATS
jgi:hypothetical protein